MIEGNGEMAWLNVAEHDQRHHSNSNDNDDQEDNSLFELGLYKRCMALIKERAFTVVLSNNHTYPFHEPHEHTSEVVADVEAQEHGHGVEIFFF